MGLLYIVVFGFGSIVGMVVLCMFIAVPFRYSASMDKFHNGLHALAGTAMIAIALLLADEINYTEQLFPNMLADLF
jgi:hypothetical protein